MILKRLVKNFKFELSICLFIEIYNVIFETNSVFLNFSLLIKNN